MNGPNKLLLDTNAVVALLQADPAVVGFVRQASEVSISIVSVIEFLSFPKLPTAERERFLAFMETVAVIPLGGPADPAVSGAIALRRDTRLKLPDAVIAAAAQALDAALVTRDRHLQNVPGLRVLHF
ncbi:MAG TPA: PIN domain-containing protein [Tepidisphaeraceae bacterium]